MLILNVGSGGLVSNFRPILVGLKDRFNLDATVIDPYFGQNAVTDGVMEVFGKAFDSVMILLLIGLVINSLTLDGAKEGISFLLRPDFSKINSHVILQALGQAFFSLSLGMGTMITYGSYIPKNENMFRLAGTVAVTDTCVAILAGLAIFPAVFSYGISPTSGPELVFITLPNVFGNMTGGYLLGIAFFFLLFTASISSSVLSQVQ